MQTLCTQDVNQEPVEPLQADLESMRRRMVMDLQWFLSQRLGSGQPDLSDPPETLAHGILLDGRLIEEKPW